MQRAALVGLGVAVFLAAFGVAPPPDAGARVGPGVLLAAFCLAVAGYLLWSRRRIASPGLPIAADPSPLDDAPIRVLVAGGEPLVAAGIRTVLDAVPDVEVVAAVHDGPAAADAARTDRVDVAVVDLPAIEALRRVRPPVPVVVLAATDDDAEAMAAVKHGADGVVLANCSPDELARAVGAVRSGDAYLSPPVARLVLERVDPVDDGRRAAARERLARLTPRESEVLDLLAQGLSNAAIGHQAHMSEGTVKTYMSRILSKLGCSNRVQAALVARDAATPASSGR